MGLALAAACADGAVDDDAGASPSVDAGPQDPPGFTRCGADDDRCQPGTRCDDEDGVCAPGCATTAECATGEGCDASVCRQVSTRLCTDDDDGAVACGGAVCAPGTWCRDPARSLCLSGCRSSVNCSCGQICTTAAAAGSGVCTDASGAPVCGDGACVVGETAGSCPADCTDWGAQCAEGCEQHALRECADFDADACLAACAAATEAAQRDFVACVVSAGDDLCLGFCDDVL